MVVRDQARARNDVIKMAEERDVRFIWLWFTDILGVLKSFSISVDELEGALAFRKAFL